MSWRNYQDKLCRYFWFQRAEIKGVLITVFVLAFIVSFTEWGAVQFDVIEGLTNLLIAIVVVGISVFVHHAVQRLMALWYGYRPEHVMWWQGLTLAGLLALFTNGAVKFLPGSAVTIHQLPMHRLGMYRYGLNFKKLAAVAAVGPLGNIILATIAYVARDVGLLNIFLAKLFYFNLVFAGYNLLPFPPLDGSRIFYGSRLLYVFVCTFIASYVLLLVIAGIRSFLSSFIIAAICWFLFYVFVEKFWSAPL